MIAGTSPRVLLCDLNNFARYPTIPIGYLASILRGAGIDVEVYSPLSKGVTGVVREPQVKVWGLLDERMRYWSAVSRNRLITATRERLRRALNEARLAHATDQVAREVSERLDGSFDAVFVSTYLSYRDHVVRIGATCAERSTPMLVGGPYFAQPEVVEEWIDIEGMTALATGEVELDTPDIVRAMTAGEPLDRFEGLCVPPDGDRSAPAPLLDLDRLPFPDYIDFPWDRYPNRIVPVVTGRGCGWGVCTFCSDVTSTAGRTYRSRSAENVLAELDHQSRRHETRRFAFTDLKLNSNLTMWDTLISRMPEQLPGAEWIAMVHVNATAEHGLSARSLRQARAAGMVRLTTGLESGSQRVLDLMKKGTDLAVTSAVLKDAAAAGISVRVTMIVGYPGEHADDVVRTAQFLEDHVDCIERVKLNRLAIMTGTRLQRTLEQHASITQLRTRHRDALVTHDYIETHSRGYRRAIGRALAAVHRINRRPLRETAREFEGVM
jgi:radical SAM superfamily enzyme YgiQ (UPF0313 family)